MLKLVDIEKNGSALSDKIPQPVVVKNPEGYIHLRVGFLTIVGGLFALFLVLFQAEAKTVLRYFLFQKGILVNPKTQLFLEKGCIADNGVIIPSHEEGVLATPLLGGNKCSWPNR